MTEIQNRILLLDILKGALNEDLGTGDLSSNGIFMPDKRSRGTFTAKAGGVLSGMAVIRETYELLDSAITVEYVHKDGDSVTPGTAIANVEGSTAPLLSGERVILNLLQHMSGIATATHRAVEVLNDSEIRICDTRKTLPGLRMLQKYAVRCGGGYNHRMRLDDMVMIKDNHIAAAGSITRAVKKIREKVGLSTPVEVETETREQVEEAVSVEADVIMFDNRTPEEVEKLVPLVPEHITTEVSGGITLNTISGYRGTGVDYISLGFLTHSVTSLDISFNLDS